MTSEHLDTAFEPTGEKEWRERIATDLAQGSVDSMRWDPEPGLLLDAVATSGSEYSFPDLVAYRREWRIVDTIEVAPSSDTAVLDVRLYLGPNGLAKDQCAVGAALLADLLGDDERCRPAMVVVPVGPRIPLEAGKLRALRLLLQEVQAAGSSQPQSSEPGEGGPTFEIVSVLADSCVSADRETHQIRLTYSCLGALLGGSDVILPTPFDDSEESRRLARNVPLILRHESHLRDIQSTANGSYYLNQVSHKIYIAARAILKDILSAGGSSALLSADRLPKILSQSNVGHKPR